MEQNPPEPLSFRSQRHPSSILEAVQNLWNSTAILPQHFPGGLFVAEVPERLEGEELVIPYAYDQGCDYCYWKCSKKARC